MEPNSPPNRIALLASRAGMTLAQLAVASRVPLDRVKGYASGKKRLTIGQDFTLIAMALQVPHADLLSDPATAVEPAPQSVIVPIDLSTVAGRLEQARSRLAFIENKDRLFEADWAEIKELNNRIYALYGERDAEQLLAGECVS